MKIQIYLKALFNFEGMRILFTIFFFSAQLIFSQSIEVCKSRFNTYLNFKGTLSQLVKFDNNAIHLYNSAGTKELSIYENELEALSVFLQKSTYDEQLAYWNARKRGDAPVLLNKTEFKQAKGNKKSDTKPLQGYRIAIDAGHFATHLKEAAVEQKYLYFKAQKSGFPFDSVKIFESVLSFHTALLLKAKLEREGAEVFLSRDQNNYTSFNCTYTDWILRHKPRVLDSLVKAGKLSYAKKERLQKAKPYEFFWEFFRDFDLQNRAEKINGFKPDLTVIIHFNVDEKNEPWKAFTEKDFTMAFIGGGFTAGNLNKTEMKVNFLRLLLTPQLNLSMLLSTNTVKKFHNYLNIPIAKSSDAKYLLENSMPTPAPGVFSRNLLLCRQINSVLVYGEALYQDHAAEAEALMKWDIKEEGIISNQRLKKVAECYFEGIKEFILSTQ